MSAKSIISRGLAGILLGGLAVASSTFAQVDSFQNLIRPPDQIAVETETETLLLPANAAGQWSRGPVTVETKQENGGLVVQLAAPGVPVRSLTMRWAGTLPANWKYLGDAWERSYGDLEWRPLDSNRVMPWYFLASNGQLTHGYGVQTGAGAFCHWTADTGGIALHADVRCGGLGVELGSRKLSVCTVVTRRGTIGETPFAAARSFCGCLCPKPRLPVEPVYGFNDWYCSYGKDTAGEFLQNAGAVATLAATNQVRPFAVVDDGWEEAAEQSTRSNLWNRVNPKFSQTLDMAEFARRIRTLGARPGLWYRPLIATPDCPPNWRLARQPQVLDPTVPEVQAYLTQTLGRFHQWGYELIKHDFTTYDLLGRWGMEMKDGVTTNGWSFADRTHTSAEVIQRLYVTLRQAAGNDVLIEGCNTVGHLSAGIFELQRIGDDTSGKDWKRTRKMGVNCLAFRGVQQDRFFAVDADCAGQMSADSVPWARNSEWLDLLGRSGTVMFTSFPRSLFAGEREPALRSALRHAAQAQPLGEPLDWQQSRTPQHWRLDGQVVDFTW